jgi:mRNA-degrading endonuclease RelE of RelBE toxin-antitoxin system
MDRHAADPPNSSRRVEIAAKARHQLQHLPDNVRQKATDILDRLAEHPTDPTPDTGRMRVGVANHYAYHARLDYRDRMYWTVETDGSVYVWQIGGHLPLGVKNWS